MRRSLEPALLSSQELAASIGAATRDERLRQELTQATLAERAGVSRATVQRLERDGTATLVNALAVIAALGRSGDLAALLRRPEATSIDKLVPVRPARQRGRR